MFAQRYFPARYFATRYWAKIGAEPVVPPLWSPVAPAQGTWSGQATTTGVWTPLPPPGGTWTS